jgi:UPF0716 family protein affecting phage T7 exclusion
LCWASCGPKKNAFRPKPVHATWWERLLLVAAAFTLIKPGLVTDLIGIGLVLAVVASQRLVARREAQFSGAD